jgi:hypothetical protein
MPGPLDPWQFFISLSAALKVKTLNSEDLYIGKYPTPRGISADVNRRKK